MLKNGIYSAQARGMAGFVTSKLEISNNKITSVNLESIYIRLHNMVKKLKVR